MCRVPTRCQAWPREDTSRGRSEPPPVGGAARLLERLSGRLCSHMTFSRPSLSVLLSLGHCPPLWPRHLWRLPGGHLPCQPLNPPQQSLRGLLFVSPEVLGWGVLQTAGGGRGAALTRHPVGREDGLRGPLRTPAVPDRTRSGEHLSQKRAGPCGSHPTSQGFWGAGCWVGCHVEVLGRGSDIQEGGARGGGMHTSPGSLSGQDVCGRDGEAPLQSLRSEAENFPRRCPNQGLPRSALRPPRFVGLGAKAS